MFIDNFNNNANTKLLKQFGLSYYKLDYKNCNVLYEKPIILYNGNFLLCGCRDLNQRSFISNIKDKPLVEILKGKQEYLNKKNIFVKGVWG